MSYDVNSLEAHWMPFTANRDFKKEPRIVVKSEGMYMWDYKGGEIIDGSSALFCTPLGHGRREIAEAVYQQMLSNDYTPHFQLRTQGLLTLPSVYVVSCRTSLTICSSPIQDLSSPIPLSRLCWPIIGLPARPSATG